MAITKASRSLVSRYSISNSEPSRQRFAARRSLARKYFAWFRPAVAGLRRNWQSVSNRIGDPRFVETFLSQPARIAFTAGPTIRTRIVTAVSEGKIDLQLN